MSQNIPTYPGGQFNNAHLFAVLETRIRKLEKKVNKLTK